MSSLVASSTTRTGLLPPERRRQQGLALASAVSGAFVDPAAAFAQAADLAGWYRTGRYPVRPAFGLVGGPSMQVVVEATNADHDAVDTGPWFAGVLAVLTGTDHVPPGRVDSRVDAQVRLVGADPFDLLPEVVGNLQDHVRDGGVVGVGGAAGEVVDEQLPY